MTKNLDSVKHTVKKILRLKPQDDRRMLSECWLSSGNVILSALHPPVILSALHSPVILSALHSPVILSEAKNLDKEGDEL